MLSWPADRFRVVQEILESHPAASDECARAALELLPQAGVLDEHARALLIEPPTHGRPSSRRMKGPWLVNKSGPMMYWTHHVTIEVSAHCLDVLTGPEGHPRASYLETHFEFADILCVSPVKEEQWDEL